MPTVIYTWHTFLDDRTCNKCRGLSGYIWTFDAEENPSHLVHPVYGLVYDLDRDESIAHGRGRHHCRCYITWVIDDTDVQEDLERLKLETQFITDKLETAITLTERFIRLLESR